MLFHATMYLKIAGTSGILPPTAVWNNRLWCHCLLCPVDTQTYCLLVNALMNPGKVQIKASYTTMANLHNLITKYSVLTSSNYTK